MQRTLELSIAVIFGIIIGGLIFWIAAPPRGKAIELQPVLNSNEIIIYITGAVITPGVYTLPENSHVVDAIKMAGGLTSEADIESINQAASLLDGARIYIPREGEEAVSQNRSEEIDVSDECRTLESDSDQPTKIININTATQEELEILPGIGPEKAQAIITYRSDNGLFTSIEGILNVPGIGAKLFEGFSDWIIAE